MRWTITGIIISYLIGSIPTAFIFGKLLKGIDIRNFGSGNVGATNALRVLGKRAGVLVLFLDIVKGIIPLFIAQKMLSRTGLSPEILLILMGVSCICGHNWTIFLNFKGGKGIATTLGVLIGLAWNTPGLGLIILELILIWILVFLLFRIVSLSSVLSALFLPFFTIVFRQSLTIIISSAILTVFILIRHKHNIARLLQGKEPCLNFGKKS